MSKQPGSVWPAVSERFKLTATTNVTHIAPVAAASHALTPRQPGIATYDIFRVLTTTAANIEKTTT